MNLAGGYLEGEAEPEVAFLGCFRHISFRTPPDFADVPTNYMYSEPTRFSKEMEPEPSLGDCACKSPYMHNPGGDPCIIRPKTASNG